MSARRLVVLFGPPGSGKGTQAPRIAQGADLVHVSTGDMLRAEVARGSALGAEVEPIMRQGALVPDELVVRVIADRIQRERPGGGVLLDGFPRTVTQAGDLDDMLQRMGQSIEAVVWLDVPHDELVRRILHRAEEEGRLDDNPEAIRRRLEVYASETAPVLDHYRARGVAIHTVDGVGTTDEVWERVRRALESRGAGAAR